MSEHVFKEACAVTGILPEHRYRDVIDNVIAPHELQCLSWRARGTLLKDSWFQQFLPPISPGKVMFRSIVPADQVQRVVRDIATTAQLHQQATGAVYSEHCHDMVVGSGASILPAIANQAPDAQESSFSNDLGLICCIVDKHYSDRIARAAIAAGAHGPVVYLAEGRGLRDRLGWLRITKTHEKDVLLVLCTKAETEAVFHVMAQAGELSKPGRGFMYRVNVDEGIFNLPSRVSSHHYAANVQQIINAIDYLSGHTHWRDGGVRPVGAGAQSAGLGINSTDALTLAQQQCLSAIVPRHDHDAVIEYLLDCGAKGVNFNFAQLQHSSRSAADSGLRIQEDYALMQCVADQKVIRAILDNAHGAQLPTSGEDWLLYANDVADCATYVYRPGKTENRSRMRSRAVA